MQKHIIAAKLAVAHFPRTSALFLLCSFAAGLATAQTDTGNGTGTGRAFWAEGADTGVGLGARYIAMAGIGTALADDVYAAYYNPAGLVEVEGVQLSVSRQSNQRYHPLSFVGAAWRLPLPASLGMRAGAAAAYYPRVHARANGAFTDKEFESVFLRYLLPGIPGTFDGEIDTKTKSYRLAAGLAPSDSKRWALGAYLEYIDCKSNFCGVHATSNGFTVSSTSAKALGFGFGVRYQLSPEWLLAAQLNDVRTRLDVNQSFKDDAGERSRVSQVEFPRRVTLEAARSWGNWQWAVQLDSMRGRYGSSELDITQLRSGGEYRAGSWRYRLGGVAPLRMSSSVSGNLKMPFPVAPTAGLGWKSEHIELNIALYAHPVMSIHKNRAAPTVDASATFSF